MKIEGKEQFLIISTMVLVILALIYFYIPNVGDGFDHFINQIKNFAQHHGYWGAFLFASFGSTSIMIPLPIPLVILLLASAGLNPIFLGLISGAGAVIGESTAYLVGRGGREIASAGYQKKFENLNKLIISRPKLTPFLVYIFAATPLPDDMLLIPLGLIKYGYWKTVLPCFLGKLTFFTIVAYSGSLSMRFFGLGNEVGSSAFLNFIWVFILILVVYLMLKINWERFIAKKNA